MANIIIHFKNGTSKKFNHSRVNMIYGFITILTESEKKFSYPIEDIRELVETPVKVT